MRNGEIQRFLGQCTIASAILTSAIGVCGYLGNLNPKYQKDTQALIKWGNGTVLILYLER